MQLTFSDVLHWVQTHNLGRVATDTDEVLSVINVPRITVSFHLAGVLEAQGDVVNSRFIQEEGITEELPESFLSRIAISEADLLAIPNFSTVWSELTRRILEAYDIQKAAQPQPPPPV